MADLSEQLATEVLRLAERVRVLEDRTPQLAHSSIEDTALPVVNTTTGATMFVGQQSDGALSLTYFGGEAPPVPAGVTVSARELSILVHWDGTFAGGVESPSNFARLDIHMSDTSGFVPDGTTLIGHLLVEGATTFFADTGIKYIKVVAVNNADIASEPTAQAAIAPLAASHIASEAITAEQLATNLFLAGKTIIVGDPESDHVLIDGDTSSIKFIDTNGNIVGRASIDDNGVYQVENPDLLRGSALTWDAVWFTRNHGASNGNLSMEMPTGSLVLSADGNHTFMVLAGPDESSWPGILVNKKFMRFYTAQDGLGYSIDLPQGVVPDIDNNDTHWFLESSAPAVSSETEISTWVSKSGVTGITYRRFPTFVGRSYRLRGEMPASLSTTGDIGEIRAYKMLGATPNTGSDTLLATLRTSSATAGFTTQIPTSSRPFSVDADEITKIYWTRRRSSGSTASVTVNGSSSPGGMRASWSLHDEGRI